jgi:hypothetical protein
MVENYYGLKTDILALNQLFMEKKVYMDRNLIGWWNLYKANEFVKCTEWITCYMPTDKVPLDKIDIELNAGRPVIAEVDINPNQPGEQQHFILIIGKTEDGHYLVYDPWYKDEDVIFFDTRYGEPSKGIFGLRLITGPVPQPEEPKPSVEGLKQQIDTLKQHIDDIKTALRPVGVMPVDDLSEVTKSIVELVSTKKAYETHLEEDKAVAEKPQDIPDNKERFLGQFKLLNLIIKFYNDKGVK